MTAPATRVLIVDDSAVVRGMLSKLISTEDDLELAGTASNGAMAIDKAVELEPDVIVLDVEMPVMSGLEALVQLRKRFPKLPIIMFSTATARGAAVTLDALAKGATDYAAKPANTGSSAKATELVREELITKIRALAGTRYRRAATPSQPVTLARPRPPRVAGPPRAVVIGSSTGGPAALETVLAGFPAPLTAPILMVQHMPSTFTGVLAERLTSVSSFPIHEATDGMAVEPGHGYLAPGGLHMRLTETANGIVTSLDEGPRVKSCRPSVDVLFDSALKVYGARLVAAILTGMGDDGCDASRRLADAGVEIIVQDEETSVVWGMPGAVARAGVANQCLPLDQIQQALTDAVAARTAGRRRTTALPGGARR